MEVEDLGHHISRRFNEDLERVRNSVLSMGGLVEEQLDRAVKALSDGDSQLGLQVAEDDVKVNRMEVSIDEECSRILATRAPTAGDLRLVIAIIKTITDLERMGDEAEKIGVLAARLASVERPSTNYRELRNLARHVKQMVHGALNAFARLDTKGALEVVKSDSAVDEEYEPTGRVFAVVTPDWERGTYDAYAVDETGCVLVQLRGYATIELPGEIDAELRLPLERAVMRSTAV